VAVNFGGGDKCPICVKTVYKMEAMAFQGQTWHKTCFNCGGNGELGCKRNVSNLDYKQHGGIPYCKACFTHNFMVGNSVAAADISLATGASSGPSVASRNSSSDVDPSLTAHLGGGDKCPICTKTVYKMEAMVVQGQTWHKTCFTCGGSGDLGCKRNISNLDYTVEQGNPYCRACFQRNFTPLGAASSASAAAVEALERATLDDDNRV
jgi:cysteine/glycine-rich protein